MLETYQLQQLISVAENDTLAAAAEQMYTSHSTISCSIKKIEEELGVILFERKKNRILLNENGKIAVEEAKKVLKQLNMLEERVRTHDRSRNTIFVASCAPAPLWNMLPYLNYAFPDMATFSEMAEHDKLINGLMNGKYQLVFAAEKPGGTEFFCKKCVEEQAVFLLPGDHPLADAGQLLFEDFNGETMLVYGEIGLWQNIYECSMPDTHFIVERDWTSFQKLMDTSTLPVFITDIALQHFKIPPGKVAAAICDRDSRQSYYCICLKNQKERFRNFLEKIN